MNACNGFFTLHLGTAYKVLPVPEGFSITAGIFSILENELSPFSFWNFLRFWSGTFSISIIEQTNRHDVFTLLIHLGYLAYDEQEQKAFIPNEEIRNEFMDAVEDCSWNVCWKRIS